MLTDVPDFETRPCATVTDHKGVLTQDTFTILETVTHQWEVWHVGDADWERIVSPANIRKTTYPWLTERDGEPLRRKHAAQGTEQEAVAARECSKILLEEYYDFVGKCA